MRNPQAVVELRDGRALVPNNQSGGVFLADFATGRTRLIGGANGGGVSRVSALAGDSTLVRARDQWIILNGVHPVQALPATASVVKAFGTGVSGADTLGHLLSIVGQLPEDSAEVISIERSTGQRTVITRLLLGPRGVFGEPGTPFYTVNERAVIAFDGWIAVLRASPYRVEWRTPAGEWVRGAPLPIDTVPMDSTEQAAHIANFSRGFPLPRPEDIHNWPDFVEPVGTGPLIATLDGEVLVPRTPTAADPGQVYAVVNRQGDLEREFEISPGDAVVGFGPGSIYLWSSTDRAWGHLERHPWP